MTRDPLGKLGLCLLVLALALPLMAPPALGEDSAEGEKIPPTEAVSLALENSSEVRRARLRLERAELQLRVARLGASLPSVEIALDSPRWTGDGTSGGVSGSASADLSTTLGTRNDLGASLSGTWEPEGELDYSWGLNLSGTLDFSESNAVEDRLEERRNAVWEAEADLETARRSTVLTAMESYSQLVTARAELGRAEGDLEDARNRLEEVKELVEKGVRGETDLMEARVSLLESRIEVDEKSSSFASDKRSYGRKYLGTEEFEVDWPRLPVEELKESCSELLEAEGRIPEGVETASDVVRARRRVKEAEETLRKAKMEIYPTFDLEAEFGSEGLAAGVGLNFDLFSPSRSEKRKIAEVNLSLAEQNLESTRRSVREQILESRSSLKRVLNDLEKLSREREKWDLEEEVKRRKYDAGAVSEDEWEEFQEELEQFEVEAESRNVELLLAYLGYREALGMELDWKEWL